MAPSSRDVIAAVAKVVGAGRGGLLPPFDANKAKPYQDRKPVREQPKKSNAKPKKGDAGL